MTEYHKFGVNLSALQAKKIVEAPKKNEGVTIRLSVNDLHGEHILPLTQTQVNKIKRAKSGVQLDLSAKQLQHMEKTGGFIPLLTLLPLLFGGLAAAGGITGGIASAASAAKSNAEQARHNRAIEDQLKTGSGVVSDFVGNVPLIGQFLRPLLQKIGLGIEDSNKICNGGCVCKNNHRYKQIGAGLYIEPALSEGAGLFLEPWNG
jgi:hypothetical protein